MLGRPNCLKRKVKQLQKLSWIATKDVIKIFKICWWLYDLTEWKNKTKFLNEVKLEFAYKIPVERLERTTLQI